jgi:putative ABC transport system substrate-binding protein
MPVIGFVYTGQTSSEASPFVAAFRQGLRDVGFIEGQNVAVEYRWPGGQYDRLPGLAAELVQRQVAVIVGNTPPAMAAKTATSAIPIVFFTGADPVKLGLVASFNRPGGNATGVSFWSAALEAKRLGLLHELLPQATVIAALVDPNFLTAASQLNDLQDAARSARNFMFSRPARKATSTAALPPFSGLTRSSLLPLRSLPPGAKNLWR